MSPSSTVYQPERRSGLDRRRAKTPFYSIYCLTGRRSAVRREQDMQRPHIIDLHSSKTFATILFIILLSILDAFFTLDLVSRGAVEINPVMAYYLNRSPFAFFGIKYLLTCASIILILSIKNVYLFKTRVQAKIVFVFFGIALALVIQWELYLILFRY
jgi:hypothetical protein